MTQRSWFKLHGWCSLPVWALFCFICITGTISVISHEITWLANPAARAANPDELPAKPTAELIAAVERDYPTADVSTVIQFESYLVHAVIFTDSDKPYATAYVNQYTGEVQAVYQSISFIDFMRTLHGWLFFPWDGAYSIGYYLVSAMSFVMIGALVTGLVIYKRFWKSFTQPKVRTHQGKKTVLADLHRLAGTWSIWFLMVMSLTGLSYFTQQILWHADIDIEGHPPLVAATELPSDSTAVPPYDFAYAMEKAQELYPEFTLGYGMLPEHNRDMYKLMGGADDIFYDQYSYQLAVNPWTGEVAKTSSPEDMNALQTIVHITDKLHYGTLGGLWTKIIWLLFGLILSGMSITGFMMWSLRTKKAMKSRSETAEVLSGTS